MVVYPPAALPTPAVIPGDVELFVSGLPSLRRGGGVLLILMPGRSRITVDLCIPTMPGRGTSGFYRPGRGGQRENCVKFHASGARG